MPSVQELINGVSDLISLPEVALRINEEEAISNANNEINSIQQLLFS